MKFSLVSSLLLLCVLLPPSARAEAEKKKTIVIPRETRQIEGWTVRIDQSLLPGGADPKTGATAIGLLEADLRRIAILMTPDNLAKLRRVTIVLDRECGSLVPMQYHPSAKWLTENGFEATLERSVHVPKALAYIDPKHVFNQPSCILHELAHAYHDQVLTFDDKRILAAFARAQLDRKYEEVLFIRGGKRKHYALTNHKEYFAEATEAWLGTNDFYPFVRSELMAHDPGLAEVLREVWGE
jgi:hypothetical protein